MGAKLSKRIATVPAEIRAEFAEYTFDGKRDSSFSSYFSHP